MLCLTLTYYLAFYSTQSQTACWRISGGERALFQHTREIRAGWQLCRAGQPWGSGSYAHTHSSEGSTQHAHRSWFNKNFQTGWMQGTSDIWHRAPAGNEARTYILWGASLSFLLHLHLRRGVGEDVEAAPQSTTGMLIKFVIPPQ